jgi:RNA polymerase sigma factor (sigma-70 family)
VKPISIIALLALALASATAAGAANSPHPTLDAVSTEVAGKPVSVHCEDSEGQWRSWEEQIGSYLHGFTRFGTPIVYIAPKHCYTLHFALSSGYRDAGAAWLSDAVATLVHESVHQRGIRDECQTEKIAQSLVMSVAERHFGLKRTVPETQHSTKTVTKVVRRKIAGKWRTIRVPTQVAVRRIVQVANPDYQRFQSWALAWNNTLPGSTRAARTSALPRVPLTLRGTPGAPAGKNPLMGTWREGGRDRHPSFAEVYRSEFAAVHRYISRRVGRDAADDVSASTFAAAYADWGRFDPARPIRPWLYGIATNLLRRHHRDEERKLRAYARTGVDPVSRVDEGEVVRRLDANAQRRALAVALADLRPDDREVLLLHAWAELSYEEIAAALSLPPGTVKSRLHRTRERLRNQLEAIGEPTAETMSIRRRESR